MIEIFCLDKTVKKLGVKDLAKVRSKPCWIDVTEITKSEEMLLQKTFDLHLLTAEDLYNQNIRIKVEEFNKYIFCVFYGVEKHQKIELVELDFILGKNFLITNHKKEVDSFKKLKENKEKLKDLLGKGLDFLFHKLLDTEVDNYFPILETIDDDIEKLEEEVTKKPSSQLLNKILKLKRSIITIKKATMPQREKVSFLAKNDYPFISKKAIPYFRDIYDHAIRVSDSIENYREAAGATFDTYMSAVSNSMNEVMKVLSIIATIALPLTVISGIYGTNFAKLPGAGFIHGFWAMILAMILLSIIMVSFFRRRRWF